jgi:hypothetical protein
MPAELAKLSKNDLVKQAEGMRRRAMRYKKNAETTAEKLLFAGAGGVSAFVMGYIMGGKEKEYQKLEAEKGPDEAKKADPRLLFGMPFDAVISVGVWVVGLTGLLGKKVSPVVEAAGFGGVAGFLYNWGSEMALEEPEEEAEEEAA